jgi:hypothetical protein
MTVLWPDLQPDGKTITRFSWSLKKNCFDLFCQEKKGEIKQHPTIPVPVYSLFSLYRHGDYRIFTSTLGVFNGDFYLGLAATTVRGVKYL